MVALCAWSRCRPSMWVAIGNSLSQHHPCKPYCDIKSYVTTGMAMPWENSVATQGDPCGNLSTKSQPQTLSQHKTFVTTWGQKSLSRPKPPSMPGNPVATQCQEALSCASPSRERMPVARAQLENTAATRKTLSLHRAGETLLRQRTQNGQ